MVPTPVVRYALQTKVFHWLTVGLFAWQYLAGHVMVRITADGHGLGLPQAAWYNWHKSIGLLALLVAMGRIWSRKRTSLPDWAPTLTVGERRFVHRAEQVLYGAMFVMPVSGFIYVMAGGYGVQLFGLWQLPNPVGAAPLLASFGKWVHIASGWVLAATLVGHIGLVLRHSLLLRDGLLRRMWF